jgi:superfamily II DNA or RNA helicase
MSSVIKIYKKNEAYMRIDSDDSGVLEEIHQYFSFEVPGAKYSPKYKHGLWDGMIRLFNRRTGLIYAGLYAAVQEFAAQRGYEVIPVTSEMHGELSDNRTIDLSFIESLNLHAAGVPIEAKDYQLDAINHALSHSRGVLLSPTGSGKSLIIYCILRWMMKHYPEKKILIVVPTVALTLQMKSDFADYSSHDDSFSEEDIHTISAGKEKITDCPVVVSTWQSLVKMTPDFYDQFVALVGDEAHTFKAMSLTSIMEKAVNIKFRIGTTGTIDPASPVNPLVLTGLFGPIHRVTTTKALIEQGTLSEIKISVIQMKYSDEVCRVMKNVDYAGEIDYIVTLQSRNTFITNLACDQKKNTLVLFNFVEKHGKPLYEQIRKKLDDSGQKDRKVFFISGGVDAEDREEARRITETEDDAIIVASSGTFAVGVNMRNLHAIIFTSPVKSFNKVVQSVGRGLRKHGDGKVLKLFDIVDDMSWKKRKNYAFLHGIERMKIYGKEGFPVKVHTIKL